MLAIERTEKFGIDGYSKNRQSRLEPWTGSSEALVTLVHLIKSQLLARESAITCYAVGVTFSQLQHAMHFV